MPLTLEDIADMMTNNKKEILSKVDGIVEDVKVVKNKVDNLAHRVDSQEETNKKVNEKIELLQSQISDLKEMSGTFQKLGTNLVSPNKAVNSNSEPSWPAGQYSQSRAAEIETGTSQVGKAVAEIIDVARRTVGLSRIDREDLERMKQPHFGGATTEEEAKLLAVKEYLRCELKIEQGLIDDMAIDNIFSPENRRDEPQYLNVTFRDSLSVSKIYEKTRIMRKESRIINFIPKQFSDRVRAISEIDYNIRLDKSYQTRIKMGLTDVELHRKLRGTTRWEKVSLPGNLPPVNLRARSPPPAALASLSPPPGRPRLQSTRDKRGRDSSGSETEQNNPKVAKQSEGGKDSTEKDSAVDLVKVWMNSVSEATLVTEGSNSPVKASPDPGLFTSIQGTPAKSLSELTYIQSPILSSKSGRSSK